MSEDTTWLRDLLANVVPDMPEDPSVDLFAGGWLDSLKLVEAIELVEDRLGFEFGTEDMAAERFSTLQAWVTTVAHARSRRGP